MTWAVSRCEMQHCNALCSLPRTCNVNDLQLSRIHPPIFLDLVQPALASVLSDVELHVLIAALEVAPGAGRHPLSFYQPNFDRNLRLRAGSIAAIVSPL